jgi:hypothetical protein
MRFESTTLAMLELALLSSQTGLTVVGKSMAREGVSSYRLEKKSRLESRKALDSDAE